MSDDLLEVDIETEDGYSGSIHSYINRVKRYLDKCGIVYNKNSDLNINIFFSHLLRLLPRDNDYMTNTGGAAGDALVLTLTDYVYPLCKDYEEGKNYLSGRVADELLELACDVLYVLSCGGSCGYPDYAVDVNYSGCGFDCNFFISELEVRDDDPPAVSFYIDFGSVRSTLSGLFSVLRVLLTYKPFVYGQVGLSLKKSSSKKIENLLNGIIEDICSSSIDNIRAAFEALRS